MTAPAAGHRWITVGDAAVAFDPVNGQGLCQAFGSAVVAAGMIAVGLPLSSDAVRAFDAAVTVTDALAEQGRQAVYTGRLGGAAASTIPYPAVPVVG